MVKTYSLKKDGEKNLTKNFKVKEFACNNGDDEILIDDEVVRLAQLGRDYFGVAGIITSGYRSKKYNTSISGAENSYHCKGMAIDMQFTGIDPKLIAAFYELLGVKGIGLYAYEKRGFVHIDTRTTKYFWIQTDKNGSYNGVDTILGRFKITLK